MLAVSDSIKAIDLRNVSKYGTGLLSCRWMRFVRITMMSFCLEYYSYNLMPITWCPWLLYDGRTHGCDARVHLMTSCNRTLANSDNYVQSFPNLHRVINKCRYASRPQNAGH